MPRYIAAAFAFLAIALTGVTTAQAQDAPWRLTALDGLVQLSLPKQTPRAAQLNEIIGEGAIVTTGAKSTARINNGLQVMVMSANSRLVIPEKKLQGSGNILQELGSIFFKVDHRDAPHFRVDTPLLAAIVKGTTFTVTVGKDETTVAVDEGMVDVRAKQSDDEKNVETGHAVQIKAIAPKQVIGPYPKQVAAPAGAAAPALATGLRPRADAPAAPGATSNLPIPALRTQTGGATPPPAAPPPPAATPRGQGGSPSPGLAPSLGVSTAATSPENGSSAPQSNEQGGSELVLKIDFGYLGYVLAAFIGGIAVFVASRATKSMRGEGAKKRSRPTNGK